MYILKVSRSDISKSSLSICRLQSRPIVLENLDICSSLFFEYHRESPVMVSISFVNSCFSRNSSVTSIGSQSSLSTQTLSPDSNQFLYYHFDIHPYKLLYNSFLPTLLDIFDIVVPNLLSSQPYVF